jgi:hypothetical protein
MSLWDRRISEEGVEGRQESPWLLFGYEVTAVGDHGGSEVHGDRFQRVGQPCAGIVLATDSEDRHR